MYESPQSFASKAAIIELLKQSGDASLTRVELVDGVARELSLAPPAPTEVNLAIDELKMEDQLSCAVVDGVEKFRLHARP